MFGPASSTTSRVREPARWIWTVCLAAGILFSPTGQACDLPAGETASVASVVDGETLALTDGRKVRLLGIAAPAPPMDWTGGAWPFEVEAQEALAKIVGGAGQPGKRIELRFDSRQQDRHGHVLAQVFMERDGAQIWLQEDLVSGGFARVYALPDLRACIGPLLDVEGQARDARRGLWRSFAYRVRDAHNPNDLKSAAHTYQLVEGTVQGLGEGRKRVYINFDKDWRGDFTVTFDRKKLALFEKSGLDVANLPGKRIRVRGWVEWENGPMIVVSGPEQIEVLPESHG